MPPSSFAPSPNMPLLESLILGIGTSVATGVLKKLCNEDMVLTSVSTTFVDVLKKKIDNVLDRNSLEREFAKLRDRSAQTFYNLIKKTTTLDEKEIEFIANGAAAVIDQTPISAELVARKDLDPDSLANFFLSRSGAQGGNPSLAAHPNPVYRDLFRRLLIAASQQIVDLSSRLPKFNETVYKEILQRENRLYEIVEKVLSGIDLLVAAQQGEDGESEDYERNFRLECIRQHDQLQLFGVDLDQTNKRYRLNVAYVMLDVAGTPDDRSDESEFVRDSNPIRRPFRETLAVDRALAFAPRMLIRGSAGAGKTTLLQWLAVFTAGREHSGELKSVMILFRSCLSYAISRRNNFLGQMNSRESRRRTPVVSLKDGRIVS